MEAQVTEFRQQRISPSGPEVPTDSVTNLSSLALLTGGYPSIVWVESLKCYWRHLPSSTLAADGITIIAAYDGGIWERLVYTTAPDWLFQAAWYMDNVGGNDENDGATVFTPIKTAAEFSRRASVGSFRQSVTVYLAYSAAYGAQRFKLDMGASGGSFTLSGAASQLGSHTLSSYTARVHAGATPQGTLIQANGVTNWSTQYGFNNRIRMTSGSANGAYSFITKANPDALGNDFARVTRFASGSTGSPSLKTPAVGDSFVVEVLPLITNLEIDCTGNRGDTSTTIDIVGVAVNNLSIRQGLYRVRFDAGVIDSSFYVSSQGSDPTPGIYRSLLSMTTFPANASAHYCGSNSFMQCEFTGVYVFEECIFEGSSGEALSVGNNPVSAANPSTCSSSTLVLLSEVQVFTSGGAIGNIRMNGPAIVRCMGAVSGRGGIGLSLVQVGGASYFSWIIGALPNIVGSTSDVRVWMTSNIDLAWSALATKPFKSDEQRGSVVLVNGASGPIAARNGNIRGVFLSVTSAVNPGFLALSAVSATAFEIASSSVTDGSTVSWLIPRFAEDVYIGESRLLTAPA